MSMKIKSDCLCEGYLHELSKGVSWAKKRELKAGDEVEFVKEWSNFYGRFYRVKKDGIEYDVKPDNVLKNQP
jgi:hypothetical protein